MMSDTVIITGTLASTLVFVVCALSFWFPWDKFKARPHADYSQRLATLDFATKQALSEMRASIDAIRRDTLGYADDSRRATERVLQTLKDKEETFTRQLQLAEEERTKVARDAIERGRVR